MSLRIPLVILAAVALLAPAGCKHVDLAEGADTVRVIEAGEASGCRKVASTDVKVMASIIGFPRGKEKVARELETMARNEALEKSANAIVPEGEVEGGERSFSIYRCP